MWASATSPEKRERPAFLYAGRGNRMSPMHPARFMIAEGAEYGKDVSEKCIDAVENALKSGDVFRTEEERLGV